MQSGGTIQSNGCWTLIHQFARLFIYRLLAKSWQIHLARCGFARLITEKRLDASFHPNISALQRRTAGNLLKKGLIEKSINKLTLFESE